MSNKWFILQYDCVLQTMKLGTLIKETIRLKMHENLKSYINKKGPISS